MKTRDMSWTQLARLLTAKGAPAVLLPLGAIEAHGPHLPLDTDTVIAEHLAEAAAAKLQTRGLPAIVAHALTHSAASWAASFAGTVSLSPEAARLVLRDALASLRLSGASRIALVNLHFDPAHMAAVRDVVKTDRGGDLVFPDFTRRETAARIGGEFATGSCHGGQFETSLMLAATPQAVKPEYRKLARIDFDLAGAIRAGKQSFREVGLDQAYCGDPASATAEEGEKLYALLVDIVVEECVRAWCPA